ncbi:SDR family oxidoreductase [soil metagenome]|nr:SDR family oxidoreductase [Rubrobacter sp.]
MTDEQPNPLSGKTAIVTGASSGIGAATARLLAENGCNVALAARREDRLKTLAGEIGDRAFAAPTDITNPEAAAALVASSVERFGTVDVVVNNAGLGLYAPISEGDPEDWRMMFDVNVLGTLYVTRAAARHMLQRGSGDIVFVSSAAGRRVPHGHGAVYAATKHAITAIAEGLRIDLHDKGIRVITVEPGLVRTEFPENSFGSPDDYYAGKKYSPLEAGDIAEALFFAISQPPRVSINEVLIRPTKQPN